MAIERHDAKKCHEHAQRHYWYFVFCCLGSKVPSGIVDFNALSYALKAIRNAPKIQNFPKLVEAIKKEREMMNKQWDHLLEVGELVRYISRD